MWLGSKGHPEGGCYFFLDQFQEQKNAGVIQMTCGFSLKSEKGKHCPGIPRGKGLKILEVMTPPDRE